MTQQLHSGPVSKVNEHLCSRKTTYTDIPSSIIGNDKNLETTQVSSEGWWMVKIVWFIHTVEYYPSIKSNKPLIHTTTRTNLKVIILSERSQSQKAKYCMISITLCSQEANYSDRKQMNDLQGLEMVSVKKKVKT